MRSAMTNVIVVIGAGSIGQAIVRRVSAGKHVVLADLRPQNADAAAKALSEAGFNVTPAIVDVSSRASVHALVETATALGEIGGVIHAAGVSPSQASPETILKVDLYGTALVLEGVRQRHRARGRGRRDRVPVRPSPAAALGGAERGARDDAG
jgi:NAD(P)-dependent dehydrogenase (short-subunit alcohol dehydrogenase family)